MARVLCAWEYGGELGHVQRLTALAVALREAGHEPALAFSNLQHAGSTSRGFRCYQAPLTTLAEKPDPTPVSLAHVLVEVGFHDRDGLAAPLRAWLAIFALEKPDVIVADYAPMALLAARVAGLPAVTIGSGFSSPPLTRPLHGLRSWEPVSDARLLAYDDSATEAANRALAELGAAPIESAAQLFVARDDILCTYAELDPFGPRENAEYLGPLDDAMPGAELAWSGEERPRIFAYLKPRYPGFVSIVASIGAAGASAIIAAPGLNDAEVQSMSSPHVQVIGRPVTLPPLLAACDLCIGHAGLGLTSKAMSAGAPMGLLPTHLEQLLIAQRVEALGAGAYLRPPPQGAPHADLTPWLRGLLADEQKRSAARHLRERFTGYSPKASAARAAQRVIAALSR